MAVQAAPQGGYQVGGWYFDPQAGGARQWDGQRFGNPGEIILGNGKTSEPSAPSGPQNPLEAANQSILDAYQKLQDQVNAKGSEFDKNNPFSYDEVLAKQKDVAKQELDPYYTQTLNDFLTGIDRQRTRSTEDNQNLLTELGANQDINTRKTTQAADQSIEASNNAAAQGGTYGSGDQLRSAGLIKSGANQDITDYNANTDRQKAAAALQQTRIGQDLALQTSQKTRDLNQEESYNVNSQALGETGNLQNQNAFARAQYVGASPGVNPLDYSNSTYKLLGA